MRSDNLILGVIVVIIVWNVLNFLEKNVYTILGLLIAVGIIAWVIIDIQKNKNPPNGMGDKFES